MVKAPMAQTASRHMAQGIHNVVSTTGTCVKSLIWVRTMIREEDEEGSKGHFTVFWFEIILLSLVQLGQIQIECLTKGITHVFIGSELGLIGTGHFFWHYPLKACLEI